MKVTLLDEQKQNQGLTIDEVLAQYETGQIFEYSRFAHEYSTFERDGLAMTIDDKTGHRALLNLTGCYMFNDDDKADRIRLKRLADGKKICIEQESL